MWAFFNGWRRKAGCVTLAMALIVTCAWVRSRYYDECIESIQGKVRKAVASRDSRLFFIYQKWPEESASPWGPSRIRSFSVVSGRSPSDPASMGCNINWRVEWAGFYGSSGVTVTDGMSFEYRMIPYWSLVLPLTLLSAHLILGLRKRRTQQVDNIPTLSGI